MHWINNLSEWAFIKYSQFGETHTKLTIPNKIFRLSKLSKKSTPSFSGFGGVLEKNIDDKKCAVEKINSPLIRLSQAPRTARGRVKIQTKSSRRYKNGKERKKVRKQRVQKRKLRLLKPKQSKARTA